MTDLVIVDFETCGLDAKNDPPVEVAAAGWSIEPGHAEPTGWSRHWLLDPERPIPAEARAIHHISPAEVGRCEPWRTVRERLEADMARVGAATLGAHNAPFDRAVWQQGRSEEGPAWVDTRTAAYHLCPDAPKLGNQVLRYHLGVEVDTTPWAPHRAPADVMVTGAILQYLLARPPAEHRERVLEEPMEWLREWSDPERHPVLLASWSFGKHQGRSFRETPRDYLEWVVRQGDSFSNRDAYVTAAHALRGVYHPSLTTPEERRAQVAA